MGVGLQIFDGGGNVVLDTSTRAGRVLGIALINAGSSGSLTNSGFSEGTPFWQAMGDYGSRVVGPAVSVNGNTLSWSWPASSSGQFRLLYGVY